MITNEDLYKIALKIARKDRKGSAFTIKEFNRYLWFASYEYFNTQYSKFELSKLISDSLGVYKVTNGEITATSGIAVLPSTITTCTFTNATNKVNSMAHGLSNGERVLFSNVGGGLPDELTAEQAYYVVNKADDTFEIAVVSGGSAVVFTDDGTGTNSYEPAFTDYFHLIGKPRWGDITVELVTDLEYSEMLDNALTVPSATYPVARISYDRTTNKHAMYFYPVASFADETIKIDYFRKPQRPVLDYYINSDKAAVYLSEGETHTVGTSDEFPVASYTPTTAATYYSSTVEMDWADYDKVNILYTVLSRAGITIGREDLAQYFDAQKAATNII